MSTNCRLRRATPNDTALLLTLIAEFYIEDRHHYEQQRISAALAPLLIDDCYGAVYVIEQQSAENSPAEAVAHSNTNGQQTTPANPPATALGYVVITWGYSLESGGREALIDEIFVRERGQGIGSHVLAQLFPLLRSAGIVKIFLETERHNTRARRFYQRAGFQTDDSIWMSREL